MLPKKFYMIYYVEIRRALRIFIGKVLGTPMLNPEVMPSVLETLHVHFFTGVLSEM
jgi:hypothetical protein